MKKTFLKLVIFVLMVFIFDRLIGLFLSNLFVRTYEGDFGGRINLALKSSPDILILGSSRAENHYIPKIIAKKTKLRVFNTGIYGQSILYHFGVMQLVCEKHVPKMIILDLRPRELYLKKNEDAKERLNLLLPFRNNVEIRKLLTVRGPFENIKTLSKIYSFNSMILGLLKYTLYPTSEGSSARGGYTPLSGSITDKMIGSSKTKLIEIMKSSNTFDPLKLTFLKRIIEDTKKRNIKLVLVESPSWFPENISIKIKDAEKKEWAFLRKNMNLQGVEIVDISMDGHFLDKGKFSDFFHLNNEGAQIFSKIISNKINNLLEK